MYFDLLICSPACYNCVTAPLPPITAQPYDFIYSRHYNPSTKKASDTHVLPVNNRMASGKDSDMPDLPDDALCPLPRSYPRKTPYTSRTRAHED